MNKWYWCLVFGGFLSCTATKLSPVVMQQLTHEDARLNYAMRPNPGVPLLFFIHGAPGSWKAYENYLDDATLSSDFQMISVDRPGYGLSTKGRIVASLEEQSRLISEILRPWAEQQPVIVIGHSYGGPIAVRLAMNHPEWVQGLLLLAPAIDPGLEKRGKWRFWLRKAPLRWLVPRGLYIANEEIISLKADQEKIEADYQRLRMPVYYIHGTADMLVPVENQYYAQRQMQHLPLEVRILKGANHFIPWTRYEEIIKGIYYLKNALPQ